MMLVEPKKWCIEADLRDQDQNSRGEIALKGAKRNYKNSKNNFELIEYILIKFKQINIFHIMIRKKKLFKIDNKIEIDKTLFQYVNF